MGPIKKPDTSVIRAQVALVFYFCRLRRQVWSIATTEPNIALQLYKYLGFYLKNIAAAFIIIDCPVMASFTISPPSASFIAKKVSTSYHYLFLLFSHRFLIFCFGFDYYICTQLWLFVFFCRARIWASLLFLLRHHHHPFPFTSARNQFQRRLYRWWLLSNQSACLPPLARLASNFISFLAMSSLVLSFSFSRIDVEVLSWDGFMSVNL